VRTREDGQEAQDESGRKRADAKFQRLLERLPAGAYICDAEGLITYFISMRPNFGGAHRD
jgi:hypothetical protein